MDAGYAGSPGRAVRITPAQAILLVAVLCAIHTCSQFLRTSIGVIAPDLAREVGLSASGIGLMASSFFFSFAAVQVPLGVALDRFGPRLVLLVSTGIAVAGTVVFAMAHTPEVMVFGRILTGIGCASFFIAPLTIYSRWFPPERFSTVVGIQLGLSALGMLGATAPLAYATAAFGWRETFLATAGLTAVIGLAVYAIARDYPPGVVPPRRHETLMETIRGLAVVARTPSVPRLFAMHFSSFSIMVTVLGLWGGPYLAHVYGHDLGRRGELLFVLATANVLANFVWGPADRLFMSYKRPVIGGAVVTVLLLIWIAWAGKLEGWTLVAWFIAFGISTAYTAVLTAHGRSLFPPELVGRGLTLLNLGTMSGVFVLQFVTGLVIDLFPAKDGVYPIEAYRTVFALLALVLAGATLIYLRSRDPTYEQVRPA
ncbi:MAG TPA: MFS transporter [Xanthobacteraceae bacterium]|jgi:MFS family permease